MSVIAVAALSARMIAEAAVADGFEVVALDLFGDQDTRRACAQWLPIGEPARMRIDADLLLAALHALARRGDVTGWIAGSGFEGRADLLERGAQCLPLIGTQADAARRVRDPHAFFEFLDSRGIAHPQVQTNAPADRAGWLVKDAGGCGGWHVRHASIHDEAVVESHYFQRRMRGVPMSVTFIANGCDASILGFNEQWVRHIGKTFTGPASSERPYVFRGVIGPVPVLPEVRDQITAAARLVTAQFMLRGMCSLDFILDGKRTGVLEVNPRPPASLALYCSTADATANVTAIANGNAIATPQQTTAQRRRAIVAAHVEACLNGELRPELCDDIPAFRGGQRDRASDDHAQAAVRGIEIVFASHSFKLGDHAASLLAERHDCHDLPAGGTRFDKDDPVCSLSAQGRDRDTVQARLQQSRLAVDRILEMHR
jgi:uncharacterized protein